MTGITARQSMNRGDSIEYGLWLAFAADGGVRMTRTQPSLSRDERAMSVTIRVPKAVFRTPQLSATIDIAGSDMPLPHIDVAAAQAALRDVIGVDVEIAVKTPDGD